MALDKVTVHNVTDLSSITIEESGPQPDIEFHEADNIMVKIIAAKEGNWLIKGHRHTYDHTSFLFRGSMRVWKDGKLDRDYHAPCGIFIAKDVEHSMLTLEDHTSFGCIHNTHGFPVDELKKHLVKA